MSTSGEKRKAFDAFFKSDEADEVTSTAQNLFKLCECDTLKGLARFRKLQKTLKPFLNHKNSRVFVLLSARIKEREKLRAQVASNELMQITGYEGSKSEEDFHVVISGAGPCGLRAAVEALLFGMNVTVVEKRNEFSRANILTTWQATMEDLRSIGAKFFFDEIKVHNTGKGYNGLHMGTREMQLFLMKTALLLGGTVLYGIELTNIRKVQVDGTEKKKFGAICAGMDAAVLEELQNKTKDFLGFKPDKTGNYEATFLCNMEFSPKVDQTVFVPYSSSKEFNGEVPTLVSTDEWKTRFKKIKNAGDRFGVYCFDFDALLLAEGEWSDTCIKLGIQKKVDRFKQAIGLVINLQYDKSNQVEKKLKEYNVSQVHANWKTTVLGRLNDVDGTSNNRVWCENIEYLKGSTHYIVATVTDLTLLEHGVLKSKDPGTPLLDRSNVDKDNLYAMARLIANLVGLPETTPFTEKNPVQVFDFSNRARCAESHVWLGVDETSDSQVSVELEPASRGSSNVIEAPVFPVGDTLYEPFWPQGLGSNRGFHGCLDTVFSILVMQEHGAMVGCQERQFAYKCMAVAGWRELGTVLPHKYWNADPINRYVHDVLNHAKQRSMNEVPRRLLPPHMSFKEYQQKLTR